MLTFPDIFNNIIGTYPNVFAKDATGAGSTDGTEYKKTVVDELLFGWLQKTLNTVGQTPNGVAETSSTSQIFDAMREAFNTPEFQQIAASGAVVFGKTNHQIELDVSLGNVDISALALSDFIGQHVHFYAVGSGIGSIAGGNGVYVNKIFITENTGGAHLWGVSGGLWTADNGVTADYVSGLFTLRYNSNGKLKTRITDGGGVTSIFTAPIYATVVKVVVFPVVYAIDPVLISNNATGTEYSWLATQPVSTTGQPIIGLTFQNGINLTLEAEWEGKY